MTLPAPKRRPLHKFVEVRSRLEFRGVAPQLSKWPLLADISHWLYPLNTRKPTPSHPGGLSEARAVTARNFGRFCPNRRRTFA